MRQPAQRTRTLSAGGGDFEGCGGASGDFEGCGGASGGGGGGGGADGCDPGTVK